jgi:hypothetical protein
MPQAKKKRAGRRERACQKSRKGEGRVIGNFEIEEPGSVELASQEQ